MVFAVPGTAFLGDKGRRLIPVSLKWAESALLVQWNKIAKVGGVNKGRGLWFTAKKSLLWSWRMGFISAAATVSNPKQVKLCH